jgi:uncharacterized protein (TIGR00266 family)
MQFQVRNKPDYAALYLSFSSGDKLLAEPGAMVGMSSGLNIESGMKGGLFAGLKRALGGESFFVNTYTASADGQTLILAPAMPGDIEHVELDGGAVVVQRGGFLASTEGITTEAKWGGAKSFFSGESLVMLRCQGKGHLWFGSYGAIHCEHVQGTYVVDTGHIVAFDESLTWQVRSSGSLKSLLLSGEGLVCEFQGQGRVWFQTRNAGSLAEFLHAFRRVKPKSND